MATKTSNLYARIEPEVKENAESVLNSLGISVSTAINMFYKQIILQQGIPFDVKSPVSIPLDYSQLTDEEIQEELEKGYKDIKEGRCAYVDEAFDNIRKNCGI